MEAYKQCADFDCMLACIAMVVQKPHSTLWPDDLLQLVQEKKGLYGEDIDKAFGLVGLTRDTDYWNVFIPQEWATSGNLRNLLHGRRALLQVRSLNAADAWHIVYWSGEALYDPSNYQKYKWIEQCAPQYVWIFNEVGET